MSQSDQPTSADTTPKYVSSELLKDEFIEDREYQSQLVEEGLSESTLIALPTGMGKTPVDLRITAERLAEVGGKALLLAPTKPLVTQHADFYREALTIPDEEIIELSGEVGKNKREQLWDDARVIISTPQTIENDIVGNRIRFDDVTHITFDECHKATGDYAYTFIGEEYQEQAKAPLVTGLSASPGSDEESILEICGTLGITNPAVITEDDPLLEKYSADTAISYERVELPEEMQTARDHLDDARVAAMKKLQQLGVTGQTRPSQGKLNSIRGKIFKMKEDGEDGAYKALSVHAEANSLTNIINALESQGLEPTIKKLEDKFEEAQSSDPSSFVERMASDPNVRDAYDELISLRERYENPDEKGDVYPKLSRLRSSAGLTCARGGQVLVFASERKTVEHLVEFLNDSGFDAARFVGQSSKKGSPGMTQKQQKERVQEFKDGEHEVLVATSVAEEGLDIPAVKRVVFYEPVGTGIRTVQRRGRTGREEDGNVTILMAEDPRDDAPNTQDLTLFFISNRKEKQMKKSMKRLSKKSDDIESELVDNKAQSGLGDFGQQDTDSENEAEDVENTEAESDVSVPNLEDVETDASEEVDGDFDDSDSDDVLVYADTREQQSHMGKRLYKMDGVTVQEEQLDVADYVLSDQLGVERKGADDFLDTITGERGFDQLAALVKNYEKPRVIIEGEAGMHELYGRRDIHEAAIRGAVNSITEDFGIQIYFTKDEDDTAKQLRSLAQREQVDNNREVSLHAKKESDSLADQQKYVVSSIEDIGPTTAHKLLSGLGSVHNILTASKDELTDVDGVGSVTATKIDSIVKSEYEHTE